MAMLFETMGWVGMVLVLGAYGLLAAKKIESDTLVYHGMNIIGALLLAVYTYWKDALPSAALNIIWCFIGLYALRGILRARKKI
ncbi:MAG: hypothetical protein SFW63_03670 [Alphaproteobacteria bacterium]|nr:hypothetical protein [Alphaproteobacteria bacterium]